MDDQRLGAAFRAIRIRRRYRQADVGRRASVSPSVVSLIERGHIEDVSLRALRQVARALEIHLALSARLPHGELDRILNADHADLHEQVARLLDRLPGWVHAPEVSFAVYGERGIIDILAFHPASGSLLVIELKTELISLEDLLSTMDIRKRHATAIGRVRGWNARSVSAWVVITDADLNRRRVKAHASTLRAALPVDGRRMRSWLRNPQGSVRALSFWANSTQGTGTRTTAGRRRVRVLKSAQLGR
jgi:transcriptional regulator with XRE-family HTH domain